MIKMHKIKRYEKTDEIRFYDEAGQTLHIWAFDIYRSGYFDDSVSLPIGDIQLADKLIGHLYHDSV